MSVNIRSLLVILVALGVVAPASAQVNPPNPQKLFREDLKEFKVRAKETEKRILSQDPSKDKNSTYFKAPDIEYLQETGEFIGKGGVILSYGGSRIQGDNGRFNSKTKEGEISGGLVLSAVDGEIRAKSGKFNLENETGSFEDAQLTMEADGYTLTGSRIEKLSDVDFRLTDAEMTTCQCADGSKPWSISSPEIDVEVEGYAKARPFFFECNDVPVFYAPYFIFPAKFKRTSGLLVPEIGYSNQNGFRYYQPAFVDVSDTADLLLTPFAETSTRYGLAGRYMQKFSMLSDLDAKLTFSDESLRNGDLRGTQTNGLFDPTFNEDRWGGFLKYKWRAKPGETQYSAVVDGRYVSDDLYLREMEDEFLGLPQDRFLTSKAYFYAPIGDYLNADIGTEYTQSFVSDDDQVLQRLPTFGVDGYRSWKIFGQNPYGFKLITSGGISATSFDRDLGYDGQRYDIHPQLKVPFYYKGYFAGDFNMGARQTNYSLDETYDVTNQTFLDKSSERSIYDFGFNLSTALEKVYETGSDTWLGRIVKGRSRGKDAQLQRVKHTVEPFLKYGFTPDEDQSALPLFTPEDRLRKRNMFYYGFNSRLIGRFADTPESRGVIEELAPENPFGFGPIANDPSRMFGENFFDPTQSIRRIRGEKREIASFGLRQSYDSEMDGPDERELSDVGADLSFFPSSYFGIGFNSNFDHEDKDFSSWGMGLKLEDQRGDHLRARFSYIDNSVSQVDGNLEVALTERLKLGFYGRYDDLAGDFVESRAALRIISSCDCWKLDLGYRDRINPDDQAYTVLLTLRGLGDIEG
jgi:LPS-assembly protein